MKNEKKTMGKCVKILINNSHLNDEKKITRKLTMKTLEMLYTCYQIYQSI